MKTNDDDTNMMNSTTKDDSSLMKLNVMFSRSQTTPEDKGRQSRARIRHTRSHIRKSKRNTPVVSWSKKLYPHCLVRVGSRNGL